MTLHLDRRRRQNRNPGNVQKTRTEIQMQHQHGGKRPIDDAEGSCYVEHMTLLWVQDLQCMCVLESLS